MTKQEKRAHWQGHVEGLKVSGLSLRAYARRAGVAVWNLQYWRKQFAYDEGGCAPQRPQATAGFLPVTFVGGAAGSPKPAGLEIVLRSGHILRLSQPVERDWLTAVVQVLEASCS